MLTTDVKTKLMMGKLDKLPLIQSRVIRIYIISNYTGRFEVLSFGIVSNLFAFIFLFYIQRSIET
jgi:hypothetical protein